MRYHVYRTRNEGRYLLDVQNDLIDGFETRVVVPLLPARKTPPALKRLHPVFTIEGHKFLMATQLLSAVPASELRESVANLDAYHYEITSALDMLFQGF